MFVSPQILTQKTGLIYSYYAQNVGFQKTF